MEKFEVLPSYVASATPAMEASQNNKASKVKIWVLIGYSVAITIALIVVAVMSGVYFHRSLDILEDSIETYQRTYSSPGDEGSSLTEDISIYSANNVAIFRLSGPEIPDGSLVAIDYPKSIIIISEPTSKICYLIGGIKMIIGDMNQLNQYLQANKTADPTNTLYYAANVDDYPVTDKSFLPSGISNECNGVPLFWIRQISESEATAPQGNGGGKVKRQLSFCTDICHTIFGHKVCVCVDV
jgi:hypothetical protein